MIVTNPAARTWRAPHIEGSPLEFHRTMAGYAPTELVALPDLAHELDVGQVLLKDESTRLGLPAFKILGASHAIARMVSQRLGRSRTLTLAEIAERIEPNSIHLTAATDGNHGRAVAHVAALLGQPSTIYVPSSITEAAKAAIRSEGAELVELDAAYDDVVAHMMAQAGAERLIVQDTSWPGYTEVPMWIVEGYTTLVAEVDEQLGKRPDIVVVPVGVGSLAQAVVAHYRANPDGPMVLAVEPENAPSLTAALKAGGPTRVETRTTVMTGLNCGTVSAAAWPVLAGGLDAAVTVSESAAIRATRDLAALGVDAGPCGAATLAGVRVLDGLAPDAVVVLLSTEGLAANPID